MPSEKVLSGSHAPLDVLIIGGGPAGLSAAIYTYRKNMTTLVLASEIGGQVAKSGEIENYLGFGRVTGPELAMKFRDHLQYLQIPIEEGVVVTKLATIPGGFKVTLDSGETKTAKLVIIASGKHPRELGVPGEEQFKNKGVTYCATCDAPLFRNKVVTVVGGGNSALDAAISLIPIASAINIVNLTEAFTGDPVFIERVNNPKVTVYHNAATTKIDGDTVVRSLRFKNSQTGQEQTLPTEGVFVEIGQVPSLQFDSLTDKNTYGMIQILDNGVTNVPGLFAAGDATGVRDNQISVAAGEGTKAALSAYEYFIRELGGTAKTEVY